MKAKYNLDQQVYVINNNRIVATTVEGFKRNKEDHIVYSLKGYTNYLNEQNIFKEIKDVLDFLKDNIKSPETIPKSVKNNFSKIKDRFININ